MVFRIFARISTVFVLTLALVLGGSFGAPLGVSGVTPVQAQERQPGLLELLFKRNRKKEKPAAKQKSRVKKPAVKRVPARKKAVKRAPKRQTVKRSTAPARAAAAAAPQADEAVEKSENARRVLVVGDFIADGMSQGLIESFTDVANVVVETRLNGSSGLVRDDFYNWPEEIPAIIEEVKPTIVVVMLGSNDRQAMRVNGRTEKVRSAEWDAEYQRRVQSFVAAVRQTNTPLMWVGSPPFKFRSMSADILAFNEIYRQTTEGAGGIFVDIWDGFVDENGNFVLTGADVKGQQVRLRASDGINFTKAGKRKMAFYVERQLKQLLGDAASPLLTSLAIDNMPMMTLPPLETEADLERINPISVEDPELDGGSVLLGDMSTENKAVSNPLQAKSVRQRLIENGISPPSRDGRAGSFILRPAG